MRLLVVLVASITVLGFSFLAATCGKACGLIVEREARKNKISRLFAVDLVGSSNAHK